MKKIVLLTTALVVVATLLLLSKRHSVAPMKPIEKENGDARGMAEYFAKIMNDPATGSLDLNAYYNAIRMAQAATASRSINSVPLQWDFLGPDNIGGRTRAILFDRTNPARVFAAGVSGGLWISNDTGQTWTEWSGSDQLTSMNIVSICQDAAGNIYFGTGEGLYGNFGVFGGGFPGYGVWKSPDTGSIQFTHLASTTPVLYDPVISNTWSEVNRLAANPNTPGSIFAATEGGLMYTTNGGLSWSKAIPVPEPAEDVKYSADGSKVFAALGGNFYYSSNGGQSFSDISGKNGFPSAAGIARIEIAVSPQTPNYAYATLINGTNTPNYGSVTNVVQTTDGGNTWNVIGTGTGWSGNAYTTDGFDPTGDQGDYDLTMTVSPVDSNILFLGGIVLWRWTHGAWLQISSYNIEEFNNDLHADLHTLVFDPSSNGNRLIIGCDGGVCQSLNPYDADINLNYGGVLYSSLNKNYNVTQFYNMSADSQGHLFGGTQDNGNEFINYQGATEQSANIVIGGDGGCTQIALSNNNAYFGEIAYTPLEYTSNGLSPEVTYVNCEDSILQAAINAIAAVYGHGAEFYAPFNLWENPDTIAYDKAHKIDMTDTPVQSLLALGIGEGEVWVTPGALEFSKGTPTWFPLQNVPDGATITALKFSADGKFLYVGTEAGDVYRYTGFDSVFIKHRWAYPLNHNDNNKIIYTWNAADSGISLIQSSYSGFSGRYVLSFATDPNDTDHLVVTCGNYGTEYSTWIAISHNAESIDTVTNSELTFIPAQGSGTTALPPAPIYSSCITHANSLILVGTPVGIWSSSDDGVTWASNNNGLANVTVMSIKELPYYNTYALYAGTHGRGIFSTIYPDSASGIKIVKGQTVNNLNVFPNPLTSTGHIQYTLTKEGNVLINLYDINGNLVSVIADENMIAGPANIPFNVAGLANGTYILQVFEGQYEATKKLVVLH